MNQANIGLLDQWKAQGNTGDLPVGWNGSGGSGNANSGNVDVVGNAQKLLDFQKTANAPVVSSLQSQTPGIQDKYTQLVNSIKGNQQLDTNRQTTTTNNELGKRGILPSSGIYQQEMTNALTPIDTQYAGLTANANAGSIQDLQGLALQIAQLQAGNPDSAISGALNLGGLQQQANATANQYALGTAGLAQQAPFVSSQSALNNAQAQYLGGQNMSSIARLAQTFGMH